MAIEFETYEYKIPVWAICALEYGDFTGLDDNDEKAVNEFIESLPRDRNGSIGHFSWGEIDENKYFAHYNDINNLGSDVVDVEYLVAE